MQITKTEDTVDWQTVVGLDALLEDNGVVGSVLCLENNNDTWLAGFIVEDGDLSAQNYPYLQIARSIDNGETWALSTQAEPNLGNNEVYRQIEGIAYHNNTWIAVGRHSYKSTDDGVTWISFTSPLFPVSLSQTDILYASGKFVIAGSKNIVASNNGTTWTELHADTTTSNFGARARLAYGNGIFVRITRNDGEIPSVLFSNDDGVTWSEPTTQFVGAFSLYDIDYGDGKFIIVGLGNHRSLGNANGYFRPLVAYSTDGDNWTFVPDAVFDNAAEMLRIAYNPYALRWLALSASQPTKPPLVFLSDDALLFTSTDGIRWNKISTPSGLTVSTKVLRPRNN